MVIPQILSVFSSKKTAWIGALLSWSILLAGCTASRYGSTSVPNINHVETVAFTSMAKRVDIIDQATSVLINSNFSITLANDRIGLVQTDYVTIATIQQAIADTLKAWPDLNNILMKVTVSASEGDLVRVKGTFQRIVGQANPTDNLIGLYWLEQIAANIASDVDAPFVHQLTDSTYAHLNEEVSANKTRSNNTGVRGAAKAGGILLAVLFAVTLFAGAFGPTSDGAQSN